MLLISLYNTPHLSVRYWIRNIFQSFFLSDWLITSLREWRTSVRHSFFLRWTDCDEVFEFKTRERKFFTMARKKQTLNFDTQYYKGIPLNLIKRNYNGYNAKRFVINHTNQNVWIPNKHLLPDGTIKENQNLDYIFTRAKQQNKLRYAYMGGNHEN